MNPKHKNPQQPRKSRSDDVWAHAPYNFVPLPEKVVPAGAIPDQDVYSGHSGYIDCALTTLSPLYTRAAMSAELFAKVGDKPFHELTPDQQRERARFFALEGTAPVIPGSSLRGMVRGLVEIAAYGKVESVSGLPLVFRAVGDTTSLGNYYRDRLMKDDGGKRYTPLMRAGYLEKKGSRWEIQPAQTIDGTTFARILIKDIPPNLKNWHGCKNAQSIWVKLGPYEYQKVRGGFIQVKYTRVLEAAASAAPGWQPAVLARSGRMDKKLREAVVFPPDPTAEPVPVEDDLMFAYREQVSQEQEKLLGKDGALVPHQPVFYLMEKGRLTFFGHVMMFRLPYNRSPLDFVPPLLHRDEECDLAEALFGFVRSGKKESAAARAGRVFFQDAVLAPEQQEVWLSETPLTPKILASPKPTTFQHYLTQQEPDPVDSGRRNKDGTPKMETRLDHYASPPPHATTLRGHKLYWNRGAVQADDIRETETNKIERARKQYTQIMPVREKVEFRFRVRFENLTDVELGALLWVLRLPEGHCHKLGMGKPLGMGAVQITPTLHVLDRASRYGKLLDEQGWFMGDARPVVEQDLVRAFERHVLANMDVKEKGAATSLAGLERIQMLLKMLEWPGPAHALTEYMEIEHGKDKVNEYKDRPVLPDPLHLEKPAPAATPAQQPVPPPRPAQAPRDARPAVPRPAQGPRDARPAPPRPPRRERERPAAPPAPEEQPAAPPPPKKQPEYAVGTVFTGKVSQVFEDGSIAVTLPGLEIRKGYAVIRASELGGKKLGMGFAARCEVVKVLQDSHGRTVFECRPAAKAK